MVNKKQLKRQLLNLRNDLKEIKELVKELENKNGEYKEELNKARAQKAELYSQYQKTRSELLKAEGRIKEAEEAEKIAKEQLAKKAKELAKAKKALNNANKENALLMQKIAEQDEQLAKAEEKGNEVDELVEKIKYNINIFEKAMGIIEDEIEEMGESATEKDMAVDEVNDAIEDSNNQSFIAVQRKAKSILLQDKADIERTINTKRNSLEAKAKRVKDWEITLNTISDFKE